MGNLTQARPPGCTFWVILANFLTISLLCKFFPLWICLWPVNLRNPGKLYFRIDDSLESWSHLIVSIITQGFGDNPKDILMESTRCYYYLLIRFWLHLTLVYNIHYELRLVKHHLRTYQSIHVKKKKKPWVFWMKKPRFQVLRSS